jgi:hypothetical protein
MERRGVYHLGPISQDAAINQWRDGQSDEQKRRTEAAENLRHATRRQTEEINPATEQPYWGSDAAEQTEKQIEAQKIVDETTGMPTIRPVVEQFGETTDPTIENQPNVPV